MPPDDQNGVVEQREERKPYSLEVIIVPQKKINQRVIESIINIINVHAIASDAINMEQRWKGKMSKIDKLRK